MMTRNLEEKEITRLKIDVEKKHEIRFVLLNINEWVFETMYEYKPL